MRALIAAGGDAIAGPFDGEESITLLADLDAGGVHLAQQAVGDGLPDGMQRGQQQVAPRFVLCLEARVIFPWQAQRHRPIGVRQR